MYPMDALRGTPLDEGLRGELGPVVEAQAMKALPNPPPTVAPDHVVQRRDAGAVPEQPGARRPVVRRSREPHRLAGAPHGDAVLVDEHAQTSRFADGVTAFGSRRP